jgi:hypothetical protein
MPEYLYLPGIEKATYKFDFLVLEFASKCNFHFINNNQ